MTEEGFAIALTGLNELKRQGIIVDYAVGGAIAAIRYIETIFTNDLDIFVILPPSNRRIISIKPITDFFVQQGYTWLGEHIIIKGTPVQFLVADRLEAEAVQMASRRKFLGVTTKLFTPEYLIAIMVNVGRLKDKNRLQMLLEQTKIKDNVLFDILGRYGLEQKYRGMTE